MNGPAILPGRFRMNFRHLFVQTAYGFIGILCELLLRKLEIHLCGEIFSPVA